MKPTPGEVIAGAISSASIYDSGSYELPIICDTILAALARAGYVIVEAKNDRPEGDDAVA